MNKSKIFKIIFVVFMCSTVAGCRWYVRGTCDVPGPSCQVEGGIEGSFQAKLMRELQPLAEMLAQSTGFTYEEWSALDPSDFSLTVQGSYVTAESAKVVLLDGSYEVAQSTFQVNNVGGTYTFATPSQVKQWSEQYVHLADSVRVELQVADTGSISTSLNERGSARASTTFGSSVTDPGDDKMVQ